MGGGCRWLSCLFRHFSSEADTARAAARSSGALSAEETRWLGSFHADSEDEQSRRAMAVAAATAIAANAAVAAARAAAEVVRLASWERGTMVCAGEEERWAAVKIQAAFRAHLARKALHALKGVVKFQALVRGYLVRKKAAQTLYRTGALVRAQTVAVSSQRLSRSHERFSDRFDMRRSPKIIDMEAYPFPGGRSPARISTSFGRRIPDCRCSLTTHSSPRPESDGVEDGGYLFQVFDGVRRSPNYMVSTRSFAAKVRSESTPRQRKEEAAAVAEQRRRVSN